MNTVVAAVFTQIADILEISGGNPFRIRSYRAASRTVSNLAQSLEEMVQNGEDLTQFDGIGKALADKIVEIVQTGTCEKLEELKRQIPPQLSELLRLRGLGAKKVKLLYQELKITNLKQLEAAARSGQIQKLATMGKTTQQNILNALTTLQSESGRISIREAAMLVEQIKTFLDRCPAVKKWAIAGSYRRCRDTIGDLDLLIASADRARANKQILAYADILQVTGQGEEKISVLLKNGRQVDFRFAQPGWFGAALLYFTGSAAHNIALRKRAQRKSWKLSEYGLFEKERCIAAKTEQAVYHKLGLAWIPPELREDAGEIQAAESAALPELVALGDIRGELHAHTNASDGKHSLQQMAQAARQRGHQFLAITDHSKAVRVASGLDEKRLLAQRDQIRALDKTLDDFWILASVEVDILKDGSLDLSHEVLAEMDWVVGSIHSSFNQDSQTMTKRLIKAIRTGLISCLGHPTARLIGRRDSLVYDIQEVFQACSEYQVCLEINAHPDRLDLPHHLCRRAAELGLKMVIATDAHSIEGLELMKFGVNVARRGWLEKKDVLNTASRLQLKRYLASRKKKFHQSNSANPD